MSSVSGPKPVGRIDHNFGECNQQMDQLCGALKELSERLAPVLADATEKLTAGGDGRETDSRSPASLSVSDRLLRLTDRVGYCTKSIHVLIGRLEL